MKSLLSALFSPPETVVAVHDSATAAQEAVKFLGHAGYPGRMLGVVARQCPLRAAIDDIDRSSFRRWSTSGACWGAVWAAIALLDAWLLSRNAVPFGAILMAGVLLLAVQTAVVWSSVAPERSTEASWRATSHLEHPYRLELAADKLLLVVKGSRSEAALARDLLDMRDARADAALAA
jgi:hypothetical protein